MTPLHRPYLEKKNNPFKNDLPKLLDPTSSTASVTSVNTIGMSQSYQRYQMYWNLVMKKRRKGKKEMKKPDWFCRECWVCLWVKGRGLTWTILAVVVAVVMEKRAIRTLYSAHCKLLKRRNNEVWIETTSQHAISSLNIPSNNTLRHSISIQHHTYPVNKPSIDHSTAQHFPLSFNFLDIFLTVESRQIRAGLHR